MKTFLVDVAFRIQADDQDDALQTLGAHLNDACSEECYILNIEEPEEKTDDQDQ